MNVVMHVARTLVSIGNWKDSCGLVCSLVSRGSACSQVRPDFVENLVWVFQCINSLYKHYYNVNNHHYKMLLVAFENDIHILLKILFQFQNFNECRISRVKRITYIELCDPASTSMKIMANDYLTCILHLQQIRISNSVKITKWCKIQIGSVPQKRT